MLADIEALLKRHIGLDAASIGSSAIVHAVHARMTAIKASSLHAYRQHLHESKTELEELIETVVVPETWFFRDAQVFECLIDQARINWLNAQPKSVLRLLSLPCSTGEEPYSMAIALLDAGIGYEHFRIDAIDISERALSKARRGRYGNNSFRSANLDFRERHMVEESGKWSMPESIRRHVRFRNGNLFDVNLLGTDRYHVIFCRNVLIYFDSASQEKVLSLLLAGLEDDGLLFVGPSEAGLLLQLGYEHVKAPMAFAFRKPKTKLLSTTISSKPNTLKPTITRAPVDAASISVMHTINATTPAKPVIAATPDEKTYWDNIELLANQGQLPEAIDALTLHQQRFGASARSFLLLGIVQDGINPKAAIESYRKALYLEPENQEALMHLAFLLERQGDARGAQVLRTRITRLKGTGSH